MPIYHGASNPARARIDREPAKHHLDRGPPNPKQEQQQDPGAAWASLAAWFREPPAGEHDQEQYRNGVGHWAMPLDDVEVLVGGQRRDKARDHAQGGVRQKEDGDKRGRRKGDPAQKPRHCAPMTAGAGVMPPYRRSRF